MKVAVIGKGKTGKYVSQILDQKGISYTVFDRNHPVTVENLSGHTHAIIFVPGAVFETMVPALLQSKIKVITGATGFQFPKDFDHSLKEQNLIWIHSTNFALGMNLVRLLLKTMSHADRLFEQFQFSIHEVHHTQKLDAPSGTALSWAEWIQHQSKITSERTGDVVGDHTLQFQTPNELITIRHQALDRSIFASGAVWTLEHFEQLSPGLNQFSEFSLQQLLKE